MSEFYNLIAAGGAEAEAMIGETLTFGALRATVMRSPLIQAWEFQIGGKRYIADTEIDILRSEYVRLALVDRSEVSLNGTTLRILRVDDDPLDPYVKLAVGAQR